MLNTPLLIRGPSLETSQSLLWVCAFPSTSCACKHRQDLLFPTFSDTLHVELPVLKHKACFLGFIHTKALLNKIFNLG